MVSDTPLKTLSNAVFQASKIQSGGHIDENGQ